MPSPQSSLNQHYTNATGSLPTNADDVVNASMQQSFRLAWDAYTGNLAKPLKTRRNQPDDNVKVNPCRLVVNKSVAFLFGKEISFQLDGNEDKTTPAEEYLENVLRANKKMQLLQKVAVNGAIYGQVFIQIVPDPTPTRPGKFPRLVNLDPTTVEVKTKPDDVDAVSSFKIQYKLNANTLYRKLIELEPDGDADDNFRSPAPGVPQNQKWKITEQQKGVGEDVSAWVTTNELDWPYPWPPIVTCQNLPLPNGFWGLPDLTDDLVELNKSLNFNLSNQARIIRYHAHPKQVASGMNGEQMKMAVDETILIPKDGKLDLVQMNPAGLAPSQANYRDLKEAFHEMAAVPEIATGKVENVGQLSGVALAILYQPLIETTATKRLNYGTMLCELAEHLLELGGFPQAADPSVNSNTSITWPELLPKDMLIERQALQIDDTLGLTSRETLSDKLGYNYQLEQERKKTEAEEAQAQAQAQANGLMAMPGQTQAQGQGQPLPAQSGMAGMNMGGGMGSMADMGGKLDPMTQALVPLKGLKFDLKFTELMIVHHQSAISMSKLIPSRTTRPELVQLGQNIIKAQTGEIKEMTGWQQEWKNTPGGSDPNPPENGQAAQSGMSGMSGK